MWKLVEICQQNYFIHCNFNINKEEVTFILYDLNDTWSQTLSLNDVKLKVKFLNKRFDFSEDNIKEALTSHVLQSAEIEEQAHTSSVNVVSYLLKLKYRVKDCFLNYEWILRKQTPTEFQQTFVKPILMALFGCHEQVEILTECLRKKDLELRQYRIEGAVLNRKTLITKPFDFAYFTKKYEDCNKITVNLKELMKYVKENNAKDVPDEVQKKDEVNKSEFEISAQKVRNDTKDDNRKLSPKQKKRKAKEIKLQNLEHHLKLRKQGIEYESSQSQSLSSGNSQTMEETEVNGVKEQSQNAPKQVTLTPRKTERCSPVKQKREQTEKTDSDNEQNTRTLRERKSTRSLVNVTKIKSLHSNREDVTKVSENDNSKNAEENTLKCVKSLNISYNNQRKSPRNYVDNSQVYDFSTDTDDNGDGDKSLIKRGKIEQTKKLTLSSKESMNRPNTISPDVETIPFENELYPNNSSTSPRCLNLSLSPTPVVIEDLSLQLNNIRKELECLEAMRLADLKQRMCKT